MFSFFKDKEFWKVLLYFVPLYYFYWALFYIPTLLLKEIPQALLEIAPGWQNLNGFHVIIFLLFIISYKARKVYLSDIKLPTFQIFKKIFITALITVLIILALYAVFALIGCNYSEMKFCHGGAIYSYSVIGGLTSTIEFAAILLPIIIIYPLLTTFFIKTKKTGKFYRILFWLLTIALYVWVAFISYVLSRAYN